MRTLVIACGALARELRAITDQYGLGDVTVECLPAALHNRPSEIPEAVRSRVQRARGHRCPDTSAEHGDADAVDAATFADVSELYDQIFVAYADCGTGGLLAAVCAEERVEMLAGAHCYQFFATAPRFDELQDHELGTFYLTDFLVRHFDRLIWQGLGIERHPELLPMYFGNYTRLVYLAQTDDPDLVARAHAAGDRLGLTVTVERTGYGELETSIVEIARREEPR
jgi:hypothetical protein